MTSKSKKLLFLLISLTLTVGLIVIGVVLLFPLPEAYVYESEDSTRISYVDVMQDSVVQIEVNPSCEHEVQKGTPSPGFAAAWDFCDKRDFRTVEIDSITEDGDQRTLILKYSNPGERGSYAGTLVQTPETMDYNHQTYTRTSFVKSVLSWIFAE